MWRMATGLDTAVKHGIPMRHIFINQQLKCQTIVKMLIKISLPLLLEHDAPMKF
jgi:hypothetical protein